MAGLVCMTAGQAVSIGLHLHAGNTRMQLSKTLRTSIFGAAVWSSIYGAGNRGLLRVWGGSVLRGGCLINVLALTGAISSLQTAHLLRTSVAQSWPIAGQRLRAFPVIAKSQPSWCFSLPATSEPLAILQQVLVKQSASHRASTGMLA